MMLKLAWPQTAAGLKNTLLMFDQFHDVEKKKKLTKATPT
jgi:aconitase B